jgi:hypothetical protein
MQGLAILVDWYQQEHQQQAPIKYNTASHMVLPTKRASKPPGNGVWDKGQISHAVQSCIGLDNRAIHN